MADGFANWSPDALGAPATRGVALTASSTAFTACRAIHAGTTETITVDFVDGGTGIDLAVIAGQIYPYRITKLTTGTGVVALY